MTRVRFDVRVYEDVRSPFDLAVLALLALGVRPFDVPDRLPPHLHVRSSYQGGAKRVQQRTWEAETRLEQLGLVGTWRDAHRPTHDGRELLQRALRTMPLRDQATLAPPLRARAARFALLVRAADAAMRAPSQAAPSVAAYACSCAGCTATRIGYAIGLEARAACPIDRTPFDDDDLPPRPPLTPEQRASIAALGAQARAEGDHEAADMADAIAELPE